MDVYQVGRTRTRGRKIEDVNGRERCRGHRAVVVCHPSLVGGGSTCAVVVQRTHTGRQLEHTLPKRFLAAEADVARSPENTPTGRIACSSSRRRNTDANSPDIDFGANPAEQCKIVSCGAARSVISLLCKLGWLANEQEN
jgi:hypothetical protein